MKTGSKDFWVNMDIYRSNGLNTQRLFFDEIKLTDSLDEARLSAPLGSQNSNPTGDLKPQSIVPKPSPALTISPASLATPTPVALPKVRYGTLIKVCQKKLLLDGKQIGSASIPVGTKVTVVSELPDGFLVIREDGDEPFKITKDSISIEHAE